MLSARNLIRLRSTISPPWIRLSCLRCPRSRTLLQIAKRVREFANTSKHQNAEDRKEKFKQSERDDGRPRGSALVILGVTGIGGVLGWYFHAWRRRRRIASNWEFVKYELVKKEEVSSTCAMFSLKPATSTIINSDENASRRSVTSVEFKQPQLQIARNYTLLPHAAGQDAQELRFLIRKERSGEVSSYIHALPLGSEIELRGPHAEIEIPADTREVLFLAGGTGIAPAMQLAAKCPADVNYHILWACRRREDCRGGLSDSRHKSAWLGWNITQWWNSSHDPMSPVPPEPNEVVVQLEKIKQSWNDNRTLMCTGRVDEDGIENVIQSKQPSYVRSDAGTLAVDYYVDEEGTYVRPSIIAKLTQTHRFRKAIDARGTCLIIVSGPDGFVNYWAGPKQWENGRETQGPLGGVLSTLKLDGWTVFKL